MTLNDFVLITGTALSLHRIWNYESMCARARQRFHRIKPLHCPACNAFWIGIFSVTLWCVVNPLVMIVLASFFPVRALMWAYTRKRWFEGGSSTTMKPQLLIESTGTTSPRWSTSGTLLARIPARTVIVMTALSDFQSSYSVSQEALNVTRAIAMTHPEWNVELWTMQRCVPATNLPTNVRHRPLFPHVRMEPDREHEQSIDILQSLMHRELVAVQGEISVITQDLLFISYFINFAKAIHALPEMPRVYWWHVCHSGTSGDAGNAPLVRCSVPSTAHTIVTVAKPAVEAFQRLYKTQQVIHIPNVRDPRTMGGSNTVQRIATHGKLWDADVVQILPACSTRIEAKGFARIALVFAKLSKHLKVQLVVCNPNAIGGRGPEVLARIKAQAISAGLTDAQWCLSSEIVPELATPGLSSIDIMHLMHFYGNVCVLPSHGEADSLVVLEARLARQFVITNGSVPNMTGGHMQVFWGPPGDMSQDDAHAEFAANRVIEYLAGNKIETSRREVLRERNLDVIGHSWGTVVASAGLLMG